MLRRDDLSRLRRSALARMPTLADLTLDVSLAQ
jgi:hypothetical protein